MVATADLSGVHSEGCRLLGHEIVLVLRCDLCMKKYATVVGFRLYTHFLSFSLGIIM